MNLNIKDRVPTKPNRFLFTPEGGGEPFYAVMTRADEPTQEGTPINKELLDNMTQAENISVSDTVSSMYGLFDTEKDVDHALQKVPSVVPQYTTLLDVTLPEIAQHNVASFDLLYPTKDFDELIIVSNFTDASIDATKYYYMSFYDGLFDGNSKETNKHFYSGGINVNYQAFSSFTIKINKPQNLNGFIWYGYYLGNSYSNSISECKAKYIFTDIKKVFLSFPYCKVDAGSQLKIIGVKYHEN